MNAARAIESLDEPLEKVVGENRLGEIKGIGDALQQKITELVTTGKLPYYQNPKASFLAGFMEMMQVPGLGPKKIKVLYDELGIKTVDELEAACKDGRLAK